jgi:glycosyltransferase involved in cell wall biosynthesis
METLNCNEIDYEIIDIEHETNVKGATKIKLNLPPITDDEFPTVSIVVPTYGRPEFFELIIRNWERIDYPREKLELIICDDTPKAKKPEITDKQIRYYILPNRVSIGEKRNLLANAAKHEYIVHMDDDDWYPPESVACRIRILLKYQKQIKKDACFGCTKVLCLDLISNQMFEAFDSSLENLPSTLSESTMAYSKRYWDQQHFQNNSKFTECLPFINNRHDTICSGPSVFIVTQFTHGKNTIQRRIEKNFVSEYNSIRFENSLSVYDSKVFNNIRAKVIQKIPSYPEAIEFMIKFKNREIDLEKFKKQYKHLENDVKANPLVINLYQEKMISKEKSSGKDIVYYCGPGSNLKFNNKWNPQSKQLGGSEEAVINLSKELVNNGYNVTVYCVLDGISKMYENVMYKPYYEWIPKDVQDITIIWRDPSICKQIIHSKYIFLDLHDAINPEWLSGLDPRIKIMTKSSYHSKILGLSNTISIPNGIYTDLSNNNTEKTENLMICTSSPDRCIRALLRALPLIRQEVPNAQIHWAYGFSAGISEGGMEKDPRTKKWVEESKELIKNTPGFTDLGRLSQLEVNELYKKGDVFIYPTRFPEIDCISLSKAMTFGCIPICTPSGAIAEKLNINSQMAKLESHGIDYSLEDGSDFINFVKSAIIILKNPRQDRNIISSFANKNYSWQSIATKWIEQFY